MHSMIRGVLSTLVLRPAALIVRLLLSSHLAWFEAPLLLLA